MAYGATLAMAFSTMKTRFDMNFNETAESVCAEIRRFGERIDARLKRIAASLDGRS